MNCPPKNTVVSMPPEVSKKLNFSLAYREKKGIMANNIVENIKERDKKRNSVSSLNTENNERIVLDLLKDTSGLIFFEGFLFKLKNNREIDIIMKALIKM